MTQKDGWTKGKTRLSVCGTRAVVKLQEGNYRVVCATCGSGGSVHHSTQESASRAATRDSGRPCPAKHPCGAE